MKKSILIFFGLIPLLTFAQQEKNIFLMTGLDFVECVDTKLMSIIHVIPNDIEGKQTVRDMSFSIVPKNIFEKDGCKYAEFEFTPDTLSEKRLVIKTLLEIYQSDLKTIKKNKNGVKSDTSQLAQYLVAEKYIEKDDPLIIKTASALKSKNATQTAQNVYDYVQNKIEYFGYFPKTFGAKYALSVNKGDCSEFSRAFVALCRAASVPARVVCGYTSVWSGTPKHDWVEYYDEKIGWIPVDPTTGSGKKFNSLENKYVYMSYIQDDVILKGYNNFFYRYKGEAPKVREIGEIKTVTIDWKF